MPDKGCEIVVVYGAGASYSSGYKVVIDPTLIHNPGSSPVPPIDPPLNYNFFGQDLVKRVAERFPSIPLFIKHYFRFRDGVNDPACNLGLEEVWSAVDLNHKHVRLRTFDWEALNQQYEHEVGQRWPDLVDTIDDPRAPGRWRATEYKLLGDCGRHLKQICYRIYGKPTLNGLEDRYWKLHHLLTEGGNGHRVEYVTFNYDTCLERSLYTHDARLQYVTDYDIPNVGFLLRDRVHIAKLHGSINWTFTASRVKPVEIPSIRYEERRDDSAFWAVEPQYPAGNNWQVTIQEPLVIPPTWFKNEINDDARAEDRITQLILHQWRVALEMLRRAGLVIVVGYSFPATDFHVQRLFRLAVMSRSNTNPLKLLYCVKADSEEEKRRAEEGVAFLQIARENIRMEFGGFGTLCAEGSLKSHLDALRV